MVTAGLGRVLWFGLSFVVALGLCLASVVMEVGALAQASEGPAVYTSAQAARGKILYSENCGSCHAPDLSGSPMAPPLSRELFAGGRRSFQQLFDYTQLFMPVFSPNGLSCQQTADILAFVLEVSDFPAGATELPTSSEGQEALSFRGVERQPK